MKKHIATLLIALTGMAAIPANAMQVGDDVVRGKVLAHVREQIAPYVKGANVNVEVLAVNGAPFDFPETEKLSEIEFTMESPLARLYSDRAIVRVTMSSPDGKHRDIGVPVRITVTKPVWVVKNNVTAKAHLKPSDFEMETRDVSRELPHVAGVEFNLNKYLARVNLVPGQLLDTRRVELPADVARNEEVLITITNGKGMNISVMGVALADASVGDTIRVRHGGPNRRKYYTGTVTSKNRVQVDM